jgi:hypothetical protein
MPRKRRKAEEIFTKLRQVEVLTAQGRPAAGAEPYTRSENRLYASMRLRRHIRSDIYMQVIRRASLPAQRPQDDLLQWHTPSQVFGSSQNRGVTIPVKPAKQLA